MLANLLGKSWIVEMQSFYFGCPARAGEYVNLYGSGVAFNQPSEPFTAGGRGGGQYGNSTALRCSGGGFHARLDADGRSFRHRFA